MQNNTSYRSQLYKNLIGSGKVSANELGNEDSFINNLSSPDIAKQLYGKLSTVFSKEEIGDENQFVSSITPDFQGQPLAVNPFINPPKMDEVAPMIDEGGKFVRPEPADIDRKLSELNTNPMLKRYEDLQNKRAEKENIMRYSGGDALVSPIEVFRAIKRSNVSADDEKFLNENKSQAEKLINDRKALLLQKEFIQLADNLKKYDDNKSAVEKFWTGLTKTGTLKDFASLGLTAMARNMNLLGVLKKAENNEPVTDEEQKMLQTYNYLKEIESSQDPSFAYKAGVIVQNAIPFIANMIISGGALGGVRAGISSALKVGTWEAAKQSVKGATTYGLKKLAEGAIFNAVRSPLTTTVAKSLSENVVDRYQTDENGKVVFDPNAPSDLKMLYDTYMQNYLEYFTEELGGAFTGDVAKTFVAPIFRNSPKIKALFGSSINALNKLGGNKYAKAVKEVTDLAQIQGLVGENMEEVANAGLSTVLTGSQDWKQFTDNPSELIGLTSINTLLLGGAFAAARYGAAGPSTVIENTKNKKQFFKATNELSAEIDRLNSMIPELNAQTEAINANEASRITEKAKQIAELAGKGQFSGPDNYTENSPVMLNLTEFNSMTEDPAYDGVRAALSKVISTAAIKSGNYIGLAEMAKREIGDFENKTAKNSVIIATDNDGNSFYVIDQLEQPDGKDPILIVRPTSGGDAITVTSADFTGEKGGVAMFSTEEFIDQYLQAREGLVQQTGQAINNQIDSSPVEPQPISKVNVGENYFLAGNPVSVIDITEDAVFVKDQDGNIHDVQIDDLEAAPPVTNQVPAESATISEEQPIQHEQSPENTQQQEQEQQVDEIPLTKDGQPDYDAMEPEMLTKYLKNELSPEDSIVILGDVVKSLEQSRKNISKRSTKGVNEAIAKRKQLKEIDDKVEKYNIAISNLSSPEAFDDQGEVLTEEDLFKRDFNNLLMRIRTHNMQTPGKKKSSNIAPFLIKANRLGLTIRPDMYNNLEIIDKDGNVLNRLFSSKKDRTDVESHKTLSEYDDDMQTFVKVMIADPEHIVFIVKLDRNTIAQGVRDILSETRSVASNSLLDALDEIFKSGEVEVKSPFGNPETVSLYQYLNDVLSVDQLTDEQINEDMPDDILEDMPDFSINSNNISENDNNAEQAQPIQTTLNNEEAAINEQQSGAAEQSPEQRGDSNPVAETQASTELSQLEAIQAEIAAEEAKVNTNPTEAQKEAGNYQKGHITIQGFDVTIENPKGSIRSGIDTDGEKWEQKMNNSYGYILGTTGRDSDHIDVFLGENPLSEKAFVIDQVNKDGSFDEHKVMLGFDTVEEAEAAYMSNYETGWQGLGNITETTVDKFNDWAKSGTRRIKPFAEYKEVKESEPVDQTAGKIQESGNNIQNKVLNSSVFNNIEDGKKQETNPAIQTQNELREQGVPFRRNQNIRHDPGQSSLWEQSGYDPSVNNRLVFAESHLSEIGQINFLGNINGPAKITGANDIAYLFRNLESASSENVFAVFIDKNKEHTVQYVSTGGPTSSVLDPRVIVSAAQRLNAESVYLVHNHPSGNLNASGADISRTGELKEALGHIGKKLAGSIIINLDSGKYSEIDIQSQQTKVHSKSPISGKITEPKIFTFDRQVLYIPSSERTQINSSRKVAEFLSKQKRGAVPKIHIIYVNNKIEVTAYEFHDETVETNEIIKKIIGNADGINTAFFLASNTDIPGKELKKIIDAAKSINLQLLDYLAIQQDSDIINNYDSYADKGLLSEEKPLYGKSILSEPNNSDPFTSESLPDKIIIDGIERSTKNNLGEPIAQTETGIRNFWKWFGDLEKTLRIEKLRNSKSVVIHSNEHKGKYDLTAESAQKWIKDNLRSKYIIKDTGESISITRVGAEEVTSHNRFDETHLKSIASIPELLSNAIFIEEQPSNKTNSKYDSYRYYVVGVKIDGVDYTVKVVIGVKQGKKYYDHRLTEMEKTKLIDIINQPASDFTSAGNASLPPYITAKDTKLISILQINSSKIIDDNGRPLLVYHGTPNKSGFTVFDKNQIGTSNDNGIWGVGFYFSPLKKQADQYRNNNGDLYTAYLSVKNPFKISDYNSIKEIADYLGMEEANFTNESTGIRPIYSQINQFTSHVIEKGHDGVISEKTNEIVVFEPNQIKSVTNNGEFSVENDDIRFRAPYFYSPTEQALNSIKQDKGTVEQFKAMLLKNGAKQSEMEWMQFDDRFPESKQTITKQDIQDWIDENRIEVEEVENGTSKTMTREQAEIGMPLYKQSSDIKGITTQEKTFEAKTLADKLNVPVNIITDISEIPASQSLMRRSKGWYNPKTGEISVVIPNNTSVADIQATILHEAVAHKGLRGLLGSEFTPTMEKIYDSLPDETKGYLLSKYGSNKTLCAEEYCATIAEKDIEPTLWEKIKGFIRDAFRKLGINLQFNDSDISYMLWRSKNRLQNEKTATLKEQLEDKAKADKTKTNLEQQFDSKLYRDNMPPETNDIQLSWSEKKIERWQDRMMSVKKLIDVINERGGKVTISANPYIQENLSSSRAKAEADKFLNTMWKPLIDQVTNIENNFGKTYEEISEYLMAKHAPERNKSVCVNEIVSDTKNKIRSNDVTTMLEKYPYIISNEVSRKYDNVFYNTTLGNIVYDNLTDVELKELKRMRKHIDKKITEISESEAGNNRSGYTDLEAAEITNKFESEIPTEEIYKLRGLIKQSTDFTINTWKKYGLISNEQYRSMTETNPYRYYVPLRGWEEKEDIDYSAIFSQDYMGSSILNLNRKAGGRTSKADDPLAYIASMAESAIISGNKNEVRRAAWRMVSSNKDMSDLFILRNTWYVNISDDSENPNWIEVFDRPAQQLFDEGRVRTNIDKTYDWHKTSQELELHSVPVFIDGQRMIIEFKGEIGAKAAIAINKLNSPSVGKFFSLATNMNRWIAANLTSKNPDFMLTNFTRDYFFGNVSYFVKGGNVAQLNKNILSSFKAIHNDRFGKDKDSDLQKMYEDFKMNGGQTGYIHLTGVEQYKKDIDRLRLHASGVYTLGDRILRNKAMMAGANALEYMAIMSENAMRFAVYKTELERMMKTEGVTEPTQNMKTLAAQAAKDITVNFNRRGAQDSTLSGLLGSMYAFFNASIQGSTTFLKLSKENPTRFAVAMSSMIGMAFLGSLFSALLSGGDEDDKDYDRISDYVKFNNIVLLNPLSSKKDEFFTIPTPHGFRALASLGPLVVDVIRGKRTEVDALWELSKNIATELSPLSLSGFDLSRPNSSMGLLSYISPTPIRPFVEAYATNQDYMGNQISKRPFLASQEGITPQWQLAPKTTNKVLVGTSKMINNLFGGTDNISSSIPRKVGRSEPYSYGFFTDFNPAKIEHIFEGYLGGRLRFFNDLYKTANSILDNEVPEKQNIPVFRRLYQGPKQKSGWPVFYETRDYVEQIDARMKDFKERGDIQGEISLNNYYNNSVVNVFKNYEKQILDLSKMINDVNYEKYKPNLEKSRDELLRDFENRINELNKIIK